MSKFCHNCSASCVPTQVYCSQCGTDLRSLSSKPRQVAAPPPAETVMPSYARNEDDEDGDGYIDRMTRLDIRQNCLQVDIKKHEAVAETLGDAVRLGAQCGASPVDPFGGRARPYQKMSKKALFEDFKKEAGESKPISID